MNGPSRVLRVVGAVGLLIGLLAATIGPVAAQQDLPGAPGMDSIFDHSDPSFRSGANTIYYPWVANDDDFGLGAADTSISIQNLEDRDAQIWIYRGDGNNDWTLATTAYLSRYAAKTFSAEQLGIEEGDGAPVAVMAFNVSVTSNPSTALIETTIVLSKPVDVTGDFTQVLACVVNEHVTEALGEPYPFVAAVSFTYNGTTYAEGALVPWETQAELQDILNTVNAGNTGALINPFGGLNNDGDCFDAVGDLDDGVVSLFDGVAIAGVAKQAVDGENLPYTSSADSAVSGYNAVNGVEVNQFNQWYLPIVQTNCGPGGCWDSTIRVANLSDLNSAVTVRFFPADDGSGSLQTGFQVQESVDGGDTWSFDLGDLVPDGWVGSAHIYSDGDIFAMVDRFKVGYNMWLTNTGSSADFENVAQVDGANGRYALFAPHVLMDYYGWNTGINVANLVDGDNNVSIQYFNMLGNATQVLNQRLAAHGMTYFYDPSIAAQDNNAQDVTSDPNAGVVGSAIIWSDSPVAAAIDATKYPESDPNGGADIFQGTSYSATQNVFTWQAVALVQKGNPTDGMGATSGINIMNPNAVAATANVYWVNPSGFNAQNFGVSSVSIPGFANGFVYTMTQHNIPNGFVGAAQVVSNVPVAAVSANVDYQVDGDGSAIFNAANPCGYYRVRVGCDFGDPLDPTGRSVTKTFLDEAGDPVAGVAFTIVGDNDAFPYQRSGVSGLDGSRTFSNVPAGNYELFVESVPAGYALPLGPQDAFTVTNGADVNLVNTLLWNQGFLKTVFASGSDVELSGVNIRVYERIGTDSIGEPVVGDIVYEGESGIAVTAGSRLPVGDYVLCLYDVDGEAVTENGETVIPDLPTAPVGLLGCDEFDVEAGLVTDLENEIDITTGVLNVFVYTEVPTSVGGVFDQVGVAGADVCLDGDCAVTGADGYARFLDIASGSYTVTVQSDDNAVGVAVGGALTVSNVVVTEDGLAATPASITVDYDPTGDLAQDGYVDDVVDDALVGTADLNVVMEAEQAGNLLVDADINGDTPFEGVEITIYPAPADVIAGTIDCNQASGAGLLVAGTEVDTGVTDVNGEAPFVLPAGLYCVFADATATGLVDAQVLNAEITLGGTTNVTFEFFHTLFTVTATGAPLNEVQVFTKVGTDGGAQSIEICYETAINCVTADVSGDVIAAASSAVPTSIANVLEDLEGIDVGDTTVVADLATNTVTITFVGNLAGVDVAELTIDDSLSPSATWTNNTTVQGGTSAEQTIDIAAFVGTGTTFTLTYEGATTGPITVGVSTAADVETALEALAGIVDVTVAGNPVPGGSVVVTFVDPAAPSELLQVS